MTDEQQKRCATIIHAAGTAAAGIGAGLAQVPGGDAILIMPVQVAMIVGLGRVFGLEVTDAAARSVVYASLGTIVGRGAAKVLLRFVPGLGNVLNAGVAFGVTETMGWSVAERMSEGRFGNPA
ncbi:MAG: hypothetical protein R3E98_05040 [Gemmatimonadota bacterium]|nr:hypothetical protein [Gemmatimonadota bacterium]